MSHRLLMPALSTVSTMKKRFRSRWNPGRLLLVAGAVSLVMLVSLALSGAGELWVKGGHAGNVEAVAYSADGSVIASASDDSTVKLWSANGALLRTLTTHPYPATALAFSPDGAKLAAGAYAGGYSGDRDGLGRVLIWQATNGWTAGDITLLRSMTNRYGKITAVAFSADSAQLASGNAAGSNVVYQVSTGAMLAHRAAYNTSVGPAAVQSLAFSSGGLLASSCEDATIRVWDSSWSQVWNTGSAHSSNVTAVAFSPDGSMLASGSLDQTVRISSTADWSTLRTLTGHSNGVTAVAFSPDGTRLASGSLDETFKVWDVASWTCATTVTAHAGGVSSLAFSPDGAQLASGGQDGAVKLWSAADGTPVQDFAGHTDTVKVVAISPDGTLCATASDDESIQVRSLSDGVLLRVLAGHTGCVSAIAFAPDSAVLASSGGPLDPTITLWRLSDGGVVNTFTANSNGVTALAFSPDGTTLASGGDFDEKTIELWDAGDGSSLGSLAGHSNGVTALAFSPQGDLLVSGGRRFDHTVKVWAVTNGSLVRTFTGHSANVESVAFAPDGDTVASGSSGSSALAVWQVSDGSSRSFGTDPDPVCFVAFSPDGSTLASATGGTIKLWDVTAGVLSQEITEETFRASCLAYSPNGNLLLYGREDATVALVTNALGAQEQTPLAFESIAAGPDGVSSLEAAVQPGTRYVIQSSTNLSDWTFLTLALSETNSMSITDATTNGVGSRFYRAVTPP